MRVFKLNLAPTSDADAIEDTLENIAKNEHNHRPGNTVSKAKVNYSALRGLLIALKASNKAKAAQGLPLETLINRFGGSIWTTTVTKEFVDAQVLEGVIFTDEEI